MPLRTEAGLGLGDIVLDGNPAPPPQKRRTALRNFGPYVVSKKVGWIKTKLGTDVCLGPGHIVLDGNPAPPPKSGKALPRNFWLMSIVAKRLD